MTPQDMEEYTRQELLERLLEIAHEEYQDRVNMLGEAMFSQLEKAIMLRVVDNKWMEHLDNMDMLREGIGLVHMVKKIHWWNINLKPLRCSKT